MTRFDAVQYIAHGIAKRPGMFEPRTVRGVDDDVSATEGEEKKPGDALNTYCVNLNKKARDGKIDPLIGREQEVMRTVQVLCRRQKNNPLFVGDPGVGKTAIAEGLGAQDRQRPGARRSQGRNDLRARHGRVARRHALSRRLRGTPQGRDEGSRSLSGRGAFHRRDPHRHRCGRDVGRRYGCLEPAEAGVAVGHAALHRLDDLQGVSPALREGSGARSPLPEDRREGADRRGCDRDPEGPEVGLRGLSQAQVHERSHQGGGRAVGQVHP